MKPLPLFTQDILIQGNMHRIGGLIKTDIDPMSISDDSKIYLFGDLSKLICYQDNYYWYYPSVTPQITPLKLSDAITSNETEWVRNVFEYFGPRPAFCYQLLDEKDDHFSAHILKRDKDGHVYAMHFEKFDQTFQQVVKKLNPYINNSVYDVKTTKQSIQNTLNKIVDYAQEEHIKRIQEQELAVDFITRIITDECSFCPDNSPLSHHEFQAIKLHIQNQAARLLPNVILILSSFPVLSSAHQAVYFVTLHVQSPYFLGDQPKIHEIYKQYFCPSDFKYPEYENISWQADVSPENQVGSAIQVTLASRSSFLVSLTFGTDHLNGVEKPNLLQLIAQLSLRGKPVPLLCSQVVTSYKNYIQCDQQLSTTTLAAPQAYYRHRCNRPIWTEKMAQPFSNQFNVEIYPIKCIGIVHSDCFAHIFSDLTETQQDELIDSSIFSDKTLLQLTFYETENHIELMAKRLYTLVLFGADPNRLNHLNESSFTQADEIEQFYRNTPNILTKAIVSAQSWRNHFLSHDEPHQRTIANQVKALGHKAQFGIGFFDPNFKCEKSQKSREAWFPAYEESKHPSAHAT